MKKPNSKKYATVNSYEVRRVKAFDNGGIVFDVTINDVTIYGCKVVEGKNGDFISFPQRKGSDGKYYAHASVYLSEADSQKILADVEAML